MTRAPDGRSRRYGRLGEGPVLEPVAGGPGAPGASDGLQQQSPDLDAGFFRALEGRRTRALVERDLPTLEALHASGYQLITPAGRVFGREAYLAAIRDAPFYAGWAIGEMSLRLSPAMVVLRYRAQLRFPSGNELNCWHTDSYEPFAGRWQAVWSQATDIRGG